MNKNCYIQVDLNTNKIIAVGLYKDTFDRNIYPQMIPCKENNSEYVGQYFDGLDDDGFSIIKMEIV